MDIDDSEFGELGVPTPLEMYRQQTHLLIGEVDDLQRELRQAKTNMTKVITMHSDATKERDRLKLELDRVRWQLSDANHELSRIATKGMNAGAYAHRHTGE
jgi:uncharacterized protein (DUF3084 family)